VNNRLITVASVLMAAIVILLGVSPSIAAGFDLLRIDSSSRGAALGSFPVAMSAGSIDAIGINPAGLASLQRRHLSLTYSDHPLDLAAGRGSWAQPFHGGVAGVELTWFSYGEFDRRQSFETGTDGTFSASDLLLTAAWAFEPWQNLYVGAGAKALYSKLEQYSSTAAAIDAGVQYLIPEQRISVGAAVVNLGTQIDSYIETTESLPLGLRVGGARKLEHLPLVLGVTAHYELDGDLFATASGEFTVSDQLQLRAGYTSLAAELKVSGPDDSMAGLSAGFALTHEPFRLHYALHSQGALGMVHRVALEFVY
jgi:hypothetical protein